MSKPEPSTLRPAGTASPSSMRAQSAVVRTLADTIERLVARGDDADGLREQLAQELERLEIQRAAAS